MKRKMVLMTSKYTILAQQNCELFILCSTKLIPEVMCRIFCTGKKLCMMHMTLHGLYPIPKILVGLRDVVHPITFITGKNLETRLTI